MPQIAHLHIHQDLHKILLAIDDFQVRDTAILARHCIRQVGTLMRPVWVSPFCRPAPDPSATEAA